MAYDRRNGGFQNGIGRKNKIEGNSIVGNQSGNKIKMGVNNTGKIKNNVKVDKLFLEGTAVTNSSRMLGNKLFVVVVVILAVAAVLILVLAVFLFVRSGELLKAALLILDVVILWRCMDHEWRQCHPRPQQREQNHHREDQKYHKHLKYPIWQGPESDGHKPRQKIDRDGIPYKIDRYGIPYLPCYRALNEIECVEIEDVDSDEETGGF